jgi:hypothetical protein
MSNRAERRRNERNQGKSNSGSTWLYFKPIDLVNKQVTIQLGDYFSESLHEYLLYAIADIIDRYGIMNIKIETKVRSDKAGILTEEEKESCNIGNSVVYHPPELEKLFPEHGYR